MNRSLDSNNEHGTRKIYKKTTSKRRLGNNMVNREVELSNHEKSNSTPSLRYPLSERTVIGQEAESVPLKSAKAVLKNVKEILNRSTSRKNDFSEDIRSEADGHEDNNNNQPDAEIEELSRLRCTSECTEAVAEREKRRRQRCADYPGLAFGSSIFSSDTLMKLNVIKNELHNIHKSQLKRAESEVAALNRRIQLLDEDLGRSEERIAIATTELAKASKAADESDRIRKALENSTNIEDDKLAMLEDLLAQAKLIAEKVQQNK